MQLGGESWVATDPSLGDGSVEHRSWLRMLLELYWLSAVTGASSSSEVSIGDLIYYGWADDTSESLAMKPADAAAGQWIDDSLTTYNCARPRGCLSLAVVDVASYAASAETMDTAVRRAAGFAWYRRSRQHGNMRGAFNMALMLLDYDRHVQHWFESIVAACRRVFGLSGGTANVGQNSVLRMPLEPERLVQSIEAQNHDATDRLTDGTLQPIRDSEFVLHEMEAGLSLLNDLQQWNSEEQGAITRVIEYHIVIACGDAITLRIELAA